MRCDNWRGCFNWCRAVVTKDVEAFSTVCGVPARLLQKIPDEQRK